MDTPRTEHLTRQDYEHVYEPAEDSFLLLDALESDLAYLNSLQPRLCVEIGSGSGIIITALAKILASTTLCLATDINLHACNATKRTAKFNDTSVDSVRCNLADALRMRCVDLLLFNPPYVVTCDEELPLATTSIEGELVHSWAGGKDGRRVIDILISKLNNILSPQGVLYLLLLRENKPSEIKEKLAKLNFKAVKIMERRIPGEHLYVIKITRS